MNTDTHGLTDEHKGKRLRIYFRDGEISEVELVMLDVHDDCRFGDDHAEFVYSLIQTNRPEKYARGDGRPAFSAAFADLAKWELVKGQVE